MILARELRGLLTGGRTEAVTQRSHVCLTGPVVASQHGNRLFTAYPVLPLRLNGNQTLILLVDVIGAAGWVFQEMQI